MHRCAFITLLLFIGVFAGASAHADERICDASATNCRTNQGLGLLDLINNETQAIDVGVWFWKTIAS